MGLLMTKRTPVNFQREVRKSGDYRNEKAVYCMGPASRRRSRVIPACTCCPQTSRARIGFANLLGVFRSEMIMDLTLSVPKCKGPMVVAAPLPTGLICTIDEEVDLRHYKCTLLGCK